MSLYRFHKVAWGCYGVLDDLPNGVIVGGTDNGGLMAYDASKFIKDDTNCLMFKKDKHTGAVKALDFNPFQVMWGFVDRYYCVQFDEI